MPCQVYASYTEVIPGGMLYGMFVSIKLPEAYAELGWINHPYVSSAPILAFVQEEGRCMGGALKRFREESGQVAKKKKKIDQYRRDIKHLKEKNLNLNM